MESGGALIDVLPVHINVNGKALTVEELLTSKKDLHLAVFRYAAEELRRDLRGYTETVRARLGPEAKGEAEKIVEKLEKETWAMLSAHEATPVERYLYDETYRRLVSEMLSVRTHAMSALTFFLDCAAIDENGMLFISNATLHREYKAYLRRTLPAEHGEARKRAAERLCRLDGLLDVSAAESDQEGLTPLMVAAGEGAGAATVELLLAAGSDVNAAPPSGWTALMQAAMSGDVPTILALCAAGASLEPRDREMGIGPLALASFNGHLAAAEALLAAGADMKALDKWGLTPITHAVVAGHAAVVRLLAGWGAELDYTCNDGTTPLMLAAVKGHLAVVQALCESGAALEATSHSGATALEMAEGQGHAAVAQYLRERASL